MTEHSMIAHLRRALAEPDRTIVLAVVTGRGDLVLDVRGCRVRDLVDVARSLLSEAADRLDECDELTPEMGDLLDDVLDALKCLPDPLAEAQVDHDPAP